MPESIMFLQSDPSIEADIQTRGETLFALMKRYPSPGIFSRKRAYARLMEWSMQDPVFKTQLFRFVDILPTLTSGKETIKYLQEYLGEQAAEIHPSLKIGLRIASFAPGIAATAIRTQITDMARQFVAGADATNLLKHFRTNVTNGIASTIDLLGEAVVNESEAQIFLNRNLEMLNVLAEEIKKHPEPTQSDIGLNGTQPRINLSIKISALSPAIHPENPENTIQELQKRLVPILQRAAEVNAFVNFDMESYHLKEITLGLFKSIFEQEAFRHKPESGIAVQAYLRDSEQDLRDLMEWAKRTGRVVGVRLVKGAYWDYETTLAKQRGWPVPVWEQKAQSDANFEKLSVLLLENIPHVQPAFASHNVRSVAHVVARAEQMGIDARAYEFQALYGMADDLKIALRKTGYRIREYCPVGNLLPGMAYLVRRLLENTSNEGFLKTYNRGMVDVPTLLQNPVDLIKEPPIPMSTSLPEPDFHNAANTDFTRKENREKFTAVLQSTKATLGKHWPLVIGGQKIEPREYVPSRNPAQPEQIIGYWAHGRVEDVETAIQAAQKAQGIWSDVSVEQRAKILERVADLIESRRFELNALEVYEAGKPWNEADADISEAIDFCRFYAREMRQIANPRITQKVAGEKNILTFIPRGVGVVIAPWNFPLAILCGMTVAPVVAGNAVIMKPAEQTSIIAAVFMDILQEAGLPNGVVNLLCGRGEEIGSALVEHPAVDFIAFTGSRSVGLQIWEAAGKTRPGQTNLKKVICEMGGKNALIIDTSADLDEAIPAALYSAFGFAGQKCSALSRLIVLEGIYEKFVTRFVEAAASVPVGDPSQPGIVIGPVIDDQAREKILARIEQGKREATLAYQGKVPPQGYYVPLTLFVDVAPESMIAQEEIFGPVLAILKARDMDEALAMANGTDYALTGGIFSRSPAMLERVSREMKVGNVYLNRSITGAIVERHPFGGFGMSGGGSKAGGKGYLENFLFPKVVSENVIRRGFTPENI